MRPLLNLADLSEHGMEPVSAEPTPDEQAIQADTKRCILSVIDTLSPLYRNVYEMADVEEIPLKEIGKKLNLTLPAVKSRLHRARVLVRESLDFQLCLPA